MAMAAQSIVAEKLTITGSVGVVTAKFNLEELYRRIGFAKETISRGRCADVASLVIPPLRRALGSGGATGSAVARPCCGRTQTMNNTGADTQQCFHGRYRKGNR